LDCSFRAAGPEGRVRPREHEQALALSSGAPLRCLGGCPSYHQPRAARNLGLARPGGRGVADQDSRRLGHEHVSTTLGSYARPGAADDGRAHRVVDLRDSARIAIKLKVSRDPAIGYVEYWYNGVQQMSSNGRTRYPGKTLDGDYTDPKWAVYGAPTVAVTNYVSAPKIATTFEAAAR